MSDKLTILLLNASIIYEFLKQDFNNLPDEIKYAANELHHVSASIFEDEEVNEMIEQSEKPTI